ncbi:hypothetical protein [Pseudomonas chlororaphis]|uniref:hypothetical protein n=1 Tax=Pseudomonas chlororaphis TaxID=587753 RepID=UPI000F56DFA6|nr:hypothetical protein [Pseudomonas chlororaphis]
MAIIDRYLARHVDRLVEDSGKEGWASFQGLGEPIGSTICLTTASLRSGAASPPMNFWRSTDLGVEVPFSGLGGGHITSSGSVFLYFVFIKNNRDKLAGG